MGDIALRVEHISKQYHIGALRHRYNSLGDLLAHKAKSLLHGIARTNLAATTIWALNDVSFEVEKGEAVAIIGRNGSGKSTLLKILSRITKPTSGQAQIYGRVGSLLEVGTGFHQDLTGRENIYLNGAVLGMKKAEIDRKFDEIVAFSEIEKFLDTPVKRYSSGMYMRLAFSVAAHLEPEVLIVDEVLAVGDASFQNKCLGKMQDAAKGGRTILFVSHNLAAVLALCQKAIWLDSGRLIESGATQTVVDRYLQTMDRLSSIPLAERSGRGGNQTLKFVEFELRNSNGIPISRAYSGQDVILALRYESSTKEVLRNVNVYIVILGKFGEPLFQLSTNVSGSKFESVPPHGVILCSVPHLSLQPGRYSFSIYGNVDTEDADWVPNAGVIEVEAGDFFSTGRLSHPDRGLFLVRHSWSLA
jgi:lipopolysaccharide transport system ATP-binding protein